MSSKAALRLTLKNYRRQLQESEISQWSTQIYHKLSALEQFKSAKQIGLYFPMLGEVNILNQLMQNQDKHFYLPVIQPDLTLKFYHYHVKTPMQTNAYQIQEPIPTYSKYLPIESLDLVLVPMLGFSQEGYRLGMGKGYYDRSLKATSIYCKIGLAFSFQAISLLAIEAQDVPMDIIITEKNIFQFKDFI